MSRLRFSSPYSSPLIALAIALVACGEDGDGGSGGGDPQAVIDQATLQGVESGDARPLARGQRRGAGRRRLRRQPLRPVPGRDGQRRTAAVRPHCGREWLLRRRRHRFRRRPRAASQQRLRQLRRHRVRSRPDHLRLRQARPSTRRKKKPAAKAVRPRPARKRPASSRSATSSRTSATTAAPTSTARARPRSAATSTCRRDRLAGRAGRRSGLQLPGRRRRGAALPVEIDEAKREVSKGVETAHLDVYVGDDDIVRQISAQLALEAATAPEAGRKASKSTST